MRPLEHQDVIFARIQIIAPMQKHATLPKQKFRQDIHRLRGIAIFLIVATHCVTNFTWNLHPATLQFALDIFDNSTLIFVFISGYLFQHTTGNFNYVEYLETKLWNVVVPYVIAATPGILYALTYGLGEEKSSYLADYSVFGKIIYLFIYGGSQMNYALWFIPVIFIYYVISPLFFWVSKNPKAYLALLILIPASIFIHRPTYSHGHNMALAFYFLPIYLIGMFCGQFDEWVTNLLDRHIFVLSAVAVGFIAAHFFISSHHGNYSKASLSSLHDSSGWVDWMFIQKLLLTFWLWGILRRFNGFQFRLLDVLANVSFTVYFFHLYVLFAAVRLLDFQGTEVNLSAFTGLLLIAVLIPTLLAMGLKLTVPRWSRTLVGS